MIGHSLLRCIVAAQKENDVIFNEMGMLFMDSLIPTLKLWMAPTNYKAAASVLAALIMDNDGECDGGLWTPTLVYYSGCQFSDVLGTAKDVIKTLVEIHSEKSPMELRAKFMSFSRHHGLLQQPVVSEKQGRKALHSIKKFLGYT